MVRGVSFQDYDVLNRYKLGKGEKESIVLAVEMGEEVDFIDDRLAYIVIDRRGLRVGWEKFNGFGTCEIDNNCN